MGEGIRLRPTFALHTPAEPAELLKLLHPDFDVELVWEPCSGQPIADSLAGLGFTAPDQHSPQQPWLHPVHPVPGTEVHSFEKLVKLVKRGPPAHIPRLVGRLPHGTAEPLVLLAQHFLLQAGIVQDLEAETARQAAEVHSLRQRQSDEAPSQPGEPVATPHAPADSSPPADLVRPSSPAATSPARTQVPQQRTRVPLQWNQPGLLHATKAQATSSTSAPAEQKAVED